MKCIIFFLMLACSVVALRPTLAPRRSRCTLKYAGEDEDGGLQRERLDSLFKQVNAAADRGNKKMLREGNGYVTNTELAIGRTAMLIFSVGLGYEFFSGESFLQQFQDTINNIEHNGLVTASALLGSLLFSLASLKERLYV
jgi:hypothetical protein